jgi:hypothetical protein
MKRENSGALTPYWSVSSAERRRDSAQFPRDRKMISVREKE